MRELSEILERRWTEREKLKMSEKWGERETVKDREGNIERNGDGCVQR